MDEFTKDQEIAGRDAGADEIFEIPIPLGEEAERGAAAWGATQPQAAAEAPSDEGAPAELFAAADEDASAEAPGPHEDPVAEAPAVDEDAVAEAPEADEDAVAEAPGADEDARAEAPIGEESGSGVPAAAAAAAPPPPPIDLSPASELADRDIVSAHRRFRPGRKALAAVGILMLLGVLGVAGVAYATYDLSRDHEGRILPGAKIAGVDVGGMDREEAIAAVRAAVRPALTREVTVTWEDRTWSTTPKEMGAKSDARAAVEAALAASGDATFVDKARMRVLGERLDFRRAVAIRYPYKGTKGFIAGIASSFDREAQDASIDYSSGWVEIVDSRRGREVRQAPSVAALREALVSGTDEAELEVRAVEPEVTADAFRQVLLVHIGDNKLYLYEDGEIVREWKVATGQPEYMTPSGLFEVTEKRYLPTWVNPAPTTWGASMPASIPPGPGNPLGLRAINWSAPAIRFHGTSATYSLGYNASHGCVRMSNDDVIELYDLIEVGTPIVSIVHGSLKPLYSSSSAPIAEQSAQ